MFFHLHNLDGEKSEFNFGTEFNLSKMLQVKAYAIGFYWLCTGEIL